MSTQTIEVSRTIASSREHLWELLADVTTWSEWGPFDRAELESPGSTVPDGVGAVRRFQTDGRQTRELVTGFQPPEMLTYCLLDGIPVRGYHAVVTLQPTPGGTVVTWRSRFRPTIPGTGGIIRRRLQDYIERILLDLQREARTSAWRRADGSFT